MNSDIEVNLYGTERCHKTQYYKSFLEERNIKYTLLDVEVNPVYANTLRSLYKSGKLNFPTITIGKKRLRNPSVKKLEKWLNKLIPSRLNIVHDKENQRFTLDVNGEIAKTDYTLRHDKMYLNHSEVPYDLRSQGIGKVLVEKTFEQLTKEDYKAVAVCRYIKAIASRSEKWKSIIEY
jgi:predicted GNAT family acetyltransferase/glutaredoxin